MTQLTPEQKAILSAEISTDPAGKGYQSLLSQGMTGHVVDKLNEQTEVMRKETWITDIGLMSRLGVEVSRNILLKLKTISQNDIAVEAAFARLRGKGIDIGDVESVSMIDQLAMIQGGFTIGEQAALRGLSMHPASRMEILGLPYAQEHMLREL